ncbi:hypothetical protein ABZU76_17995 [Amycolatopsis sp. NPDC005232]|uniref:hypothetical protein n=1 Tax=Amycolatopsis sp. NPDC005232 TaxID=3157027 RepID=UPI0033A81CA8
MHSTVAISGRRSLASECSTGRSADADAGALASVGSGDDSYDNAMDEAFSRSNRETGLAHEPLGCASRHIHP